jgi:hypothetical protein
LQHGNHWGMLRKIMNTTFDWSAIISAASGLAGVFIGGFFTLKGVEKQHKHSLVVQRQEHERKIDGILQAIQYELEILGEMYAKEAGRLLNALKEREPFMVYFSLTEKYFIVYPNNTGLVAQIKDADLCRSIVVTYNKVNFLVELFRINNWYLDQRKECARLAVEDAKYVSFGNNLLAKQIQHSTLLQAADSALRDEAVALLGKIKAYRQRQRSGCTPGETVARSEAAIHGKGAVVSGVSAC